VREPKVVKPEINGFKHAAVLKKFSGGLKFLNEFCVFGQYLPSAVYSVENPDRSKGHKDFLTLFLSEGRLWVGGISKPDMEKFRYQPAVLCEKCNTIAYSAYRHHAATCECGQAMIDGGKDYVRRTGGGIDVTLDLLTDKIVPGGASVGRKSASKQPKTKTPRQAGPKIKRSQTASGRRATRKQPGKKPPRPR